MTDFEGIELALAKKEKELEQQEAQLRSERELLEQQKQALLLLKPLMGSSVRPPDLQSSNGVKAGSDHGTPLSIRDAISEALSTIPDDTAFSSRDIYERMRTMSLSFDLEKNRANISTYLRQFAAGGEIQIREGGGQGQTPHLYGKK